jgi:hypothetical protein
MSIVNGIIQPHLPMIINNKLNASKYIKFNLDIFTIANNAHVNVNKFNNEMLHSIYDNINNMITYLQPYANILFICNDLYGYGGSATNCNILQNFFSHTHNTHTIYIADYINPRAIFATLVFRPDIVILKSFVNINLKKFFKVPLLYFVGGIFMDNLNKPLSTINVPEYINPFVINQIKYADITFANSIHTAKLLKNACSLNIYVFFSTFVQYYGTFIINNHGYNRRYKYGIIISNFKRQIKNALHSINKIKDYANKSILIGKNSSMFKEYGFTCTGLLSHKDTIKYLSHIDEVIIDSHFESCSNVYVESVFNGCRVQIIDYGI